MCVGVNVGGGGREGDRRDEKRRGGKGEKRRGGVGEGRADVLNNLTGISCQT
jgi:hypothetical protein